MMKSHGLGKDGRLRVMRVKSLKHSKQVRGKSPYEPHEGVRMSKVSIQISGRVDVNETQSSASHERLHESR